MQRTVTILLSDKRSGSTMLERELCKHSSVNNVAYTPHSYNETHYWLKAACLLPVPDQQFYRAVRPRSYGSCGAIRTSLINFLQRNIPEFVAPENDEVLVLEGWSALCDRF